jgi:RNA polymerase sigma-70 factor (ECF subfamily)
MNAEQQDPALVQAAVEGDTAALKLLLLGNHGRLCEYIGRKIPLDLRGLVEPEDIAQEAYIQVFRHIRGLQPAQPDAFARWTATIALRKLRNVIKAQRAARRGGGKRGATGSPATEDSMVGLLDLVAAPGPTPSRALARGDAVQAMQAALAGIPEHYRQAVWLVYIEGRSVADAAAQMGRTERAVHGLCRSALKLLRERMGSASRYLSSTE